MIPEYNDNMKIVIVYHGGCLDGIAASWVMRHYFTTIKHKRNNEITLIGMAPQCINLLGELHNHNIKLESESYNIIFVDICPAIYILQNIIRLNEQSGNLSRFEVYDHHITNKDIFKTFHSDLIGNMTWVFDMDRCGCQIAWDEFMQSPVLGIPEPRPTFIDYVADGDLWKWELPDGKLIYNILQDNFRHIDMMQTLYEVGEEYFTDTSEYGFKNQYLKKAKHIQEYKQTQIDKFISKAQHRRVKVNYPKGNKVRTYNIWVVECMDYALGSELGSQLCKKKLIPYDMINDMPNDNILNDNPPSDDTSEIMETVSDIKSKLTYPDFVLIIKGINYNLDNNCDPGLEYNISLRSNKNTKPDINVGEIATTYEGGGHPQAAGFTITHKELCELFC